MWDRYDVRDSHRDRGGGWDRNFGSRGGTSERDRNDERDPQDVFTKDLDLPQGRDRQPVRERDRVYEINRSESRMLATVGAFRVVSENNLHDGRNDTRSAQHHLEREGLLQMSALSSDDRAVVLTDRGRDLLEANRREQERSWEPRQTFYAGLRKPRELMHDSNVYRTYLRAEERLREQGGRVNRVVLDYELTPCGHWQTHTVVAALRPTALTATAVFDGPMTPSPSVRMSSRSWCRRCGRRNCPGSAEWSPCCRAPPASAGQALGWR